VEEMICGTDRFGRREAAGIVVDLFWDRRDLHDEFRVEVKDRRDGTRFVLYRARGDPGLSSPVLGAARHTGGVRGPGLTRSCCLRQDGVRSQPKGF
jgi:hypothetical protein